MITNSEFLHTLYGPLGQGVHGWVTCFAGDPNAAGPDQWTGQLYVGTPNARLMIDRRGEQNTYYSVARLKLNGERPRRSKHNFATLAALVADDADPADLNGTPSFVIETSPGNHQIGVLLDAEDANVRDAALVDAVMQTMADAQLVRADSSGNNSVRYCRLPAGVNGKGGHNYPVSLREWRPEHRLSLADALGVFGIDLDAVRTRVSRVTQSVKDVPADAENAELLRRILTGESYHDPLMKLSAKLVAAGAAGGAVVNHLRGLMDAARPSEPGELERWQARYAEIPRMVQGAERFRPAPVAPVTINLGSPRPVEASAALAPMDWAALAAHAPEPAPFRWAGWLPARTTTLLSANGGVGKSNLSLQLAASLALGKPFLGEAVEACKVLVVSAEDSERTMHFRIQNILTDLGAALTDLAGRLVAFDLTQHDCVMWRDGLPTARMQWLADVVKEHAAEVVILDNASDVFNSNENDRAEVRGFMRCLNAIALQSGAAVLLLAHVDKQSVRFGEAKDSNTTFSGSTAWNNSARSRWAMTRGDGSVSLRHEKCNYGALQDELELEFDAAARVFRRFGQVASTAFARNLLRDAKRVEILKILVAAQQRGILISPSEHARGASDAYKACQKVIPDRRAFFSELTHMRLDELLTVRDIVRDRKTREQLVVAPAGNRLLGEG